MAFPKRTFAECDAILCAPGMPHEVETCLVGGRVQRVYKNLWPSVRDFWLSNCAQYGDKTWLVFEGERMTYQEATEQSARAAVMLRDVYRVQKGDRVAICSRNLPQGLLVFWACQLIGAIPTFVNTYLPLKPLLHCFTHTGSSVLFVDTERADRIASSTRYLLAKGVRGIVVLDSFVHHSRWDSFDLWEDIMKAVTVDMKALIADDPRLVPEDDAVIIFTSGTTGLPKGVVSTHRNFLHMLRNPNRTSTRLDFGQATIGSLRAYLREGLDLPKPPAPGEPQTGMLVGVPLFHISGLSFSTIAVAGGMKIIMMSKWRVNEGNSGPVLAVFASNHAARLIKAENIQSCGGVPSLVSDLIDSDLKGHPFKFFLFGGAPAYPQLPQKARDVFPFAMLTHSFGMTESNGVCVAVAGLDYELRPSSSGLTTPVNDMIIVRDGKVITDGTPGEVWLRGPNIMRGYWNDPVATTKALTEDGWHKSGDLGCIDSDGQLHIRDRIKDIIIRNGENIDSTSVENAIYLDDRVYQAAAVGIPDARLGELVAVIVSTKEGYEGAVTERELMKLAHENLPKFAWPYMILVQDTPLELTPSGKITKLPLRELANKEWQARQAMKIEERAHL